MESIGNFFSSLPTFVQAMIIVAVFLAASAMNGYNTIHGSFPGGEVEPRKKETPSKAF